MMMMEDSSMMLNESNIAMNSQMSYGGGEDEADYGNGGGRVIREIIV